MTWRSHLAGQVRVGDRVWARDLTSGKSTLREVTGLFAKRADRLVHISVAGAVIQVTPEHPFYSPDKGWSTPGQLRMGDRLLARTHGISLARSSTRSGFHGRG